MKAQAMKTHINIPGTAKIIQDEKERYFLEGCMKEEGRKVVISVNVFKPITKMGKKNCTRKVSIRMKEEEEGKM